MERYDIAIIGTGPGGLEAAITAKVRNKNVLLLGSKTSSLKVEKAHEILNYLGLPNIKGSDLQKAFLSHAESMGVEITDDRVIAIYPLGDYFGIQARDGMYEASSIILATGVVMSKPYPGENEFLGKGVSYCATCDAALYKDKVTAIIGSSPKEEEEANFMSEYASKVLYFPLYKEETSTNDKVEVIHETPKEILGDTIVHTLRTDQNDYTVDGVFVLREAVSPGQLLSGLETSGPHVVVDINMTTNIPGVFACGDIAGTPYQYIKAAGQGNIATLSAVNYLTTLKK
ncbi:MAG: NAD(P)/FAD-dependent oxidoreductase [Solobacterium sp.]|nr:NAD(P)/FAD-dependent oxidoreductase [Solobacterium sp.]